jgi:HSP20 family molecular chaperone IbpA
MEVFMSILARKSQAENRISPRSYFDRLFEDTFESMVNDLFPHHLGMEYHRNTEDGTLNISVDIPGIQEADINIELVDNTITIKGERKTPSSSYTVQKSLSIPEGYDQEDIKAELKNGVLILTLIGKSSPKPEPKKITIKST